ncbi:MAG: LCP family protein [Actinomycetota bacterium]
MTNPLRIMSRPVLLKWRTVTLVLALGLAWSVWWIGLPFRAAGQSSSPAAIGIHKVQGASWSPETGQPLFIAVLGSDARVAPPDGGGGRCDAVHIVAINPTTKAGTVLNFPRDSWVNIPGRGANKINSACSSGGGELMVQTLKSLTGIPIQYYAITEFSHFVKFIDVLGGLDVNVPYKMADSPSGAFFPAGPIHMTGGQTLAITRNRKDTPRGDFSRSENQGIVILAGLGKFRSEMADPHRIFDYIKAARQNIKSSVPLMDMVKLGILAKDVDPAQMKNLLMPGSTGSAGGASVVFLAPGDIYSRVRDDAIY